MPIYLRALEPEDLELLYTIENAPQLWAVNSNPEPYSRFALRKYIEEQPNNIYQTGAMRLIICRESDNEAIGIVDLSLLLATPAVAGAQIHPQRQN